MDRRSNWLRGVSDLLGPAGSTEGESYGCALAARSDGAGLGRIRGGALCPVPHRLEEAGLVVAGFRAAEKGPGRRHHHLSDQGREVPNGQGTARLEFDGPVRAALDQGGIR